MESRYDFMTTSNVKDTDGDTYPDILSTNYSNFAIENVADMTPHIITSNDISRMWCHMKKVYNITYYDDILLNMNGIGYVGMLEPGSVIYDFNIKDIIGFNTNKLKESEED